MKTIFENKYKYRREAEEFSAKCPYALKECNDICTNGLYNLKSHCTQCYNEKKYNIKNGRCFETEGRKYVQQQQEANKYKVELAQNCKYAENSRYCEMKDTLEICNYCNKSFSR